MKICSSSPSIIYYFSESPKISFFEPLRALDRAETKKKSQIIFKFQKFFCVDGMGGKNEDKMNETLMIDEGHMTLSMIVVCLKSE